MNHSNAESKVAIVIDLLAKSGEIDYIGEPISQLEHALQCGFFATKAQAPEDVVLAALLHDIGHFCGPSDAPQMAGYGVMSHEEIAADFLSELGFSKKVSELVKGHVQAKRYLVAKNPKYLAQMSEASKRTLEFQGGPMNPAELAAMEQDSLFKDKLRMRQWDEQAKNTDLQVPGLDSYREILLRHFQSA